MRLLAQFIIPALIFIVVYMLLTKRSFQSEAVKQNLTDETSTPFSNRPLSNLGIVSILIISALVTLASILILQQLLA